MPALESVLDQPDTVLFVGSGISLWSGLPTWGGVIEKLAVYLEQNGFDPSLVRKEAAKGELLQAASFGFDNLTPHQVGDFIRSAVGYGKAKPHEIHKKILSLGPRCFITTNYDDLLEQSVRLWIRDRFYKPPVTNRHLMELAEIVHARATDFIFKPHGDAADSESIILTREQYRKLLPHGPRYATAETLRTVMATRPIVYIGFGLRDPDFLLLRESLLNTYSGAVRDHYAIVNDVTAEEVGYWRRNYGIHLIPYESTPRQDGSRDHSPLLALLDKLVNRPRAEEPAVSQSSDIAMALLRHVARYIAPASTNANFRLRVKSRSQRRNEGRYFRDEYDHWYLDRFLVEGPNLSVIVAPPGAGKTFALNHAAATMGQKAQRLLISNSGSEKIVIPLLIDLKLYSGSINDLIISVLPAGVSFVGLLKSFDVRILIDAADETPRSFLENGSFEADLQNFTENNPQLRVVLASRTSDILSFLEFPTYEIDQVDEAFVVLALKSAGVSIAGEFEQELTRLLSRPYYFQLVSSGQLQLPDKPHPRDIYRMVLDRRSEKLRSDLKIDMDIASAMSRVAFDSLNDGRDTFSVHAVMISILRKYSDMSEAGVDDVINFLISEHLVVPHHGGRLSFVHKSITEYLAGVHLSEWYAADRGALLSALENRRWDQAIFMALGFLDGETLRRFYADIARSDLALAINATKYLEVDADQILHELMEKILALPNSEMATSHEISFALEKSAPFTISHVPTLRRAVEAGGVLGAAAAKALVRLLGAETKSYLLDMMYEKYDDYNLLANGIGGSLSDFVDDQDISKIATFAKLLRESNYSREDMSGFITGSAYLLAKLDPNKIYAEFAEGPNSSTTTLAVAAAIAYERHDEQGLVLAAKLLLIGETEATFALSSTTHVDYPIDWSFLVDRHVEKLIAAMRAGDVWAADALKNVLENRPDLGVALPVYTEALSTSEAALLDSFVYSRNTEYVHRYISELLDDGTSASPLGALIIERMDLDWSKTSSIVEKMMVARRYDIFDAITDSGVPCRINGLPSLSVPDTEALLDWLLELRTADSPWQLMRLGSMVGLQADRPLREALILEFRDVKSPYHDILREYVLPNISNLTSDDLSEEVVGRLLFDLEGAPILPGWRGHLLGHIATERFISETLLPIYRRSAGSLRHNLQAIIVQAGRSHGRRYIETGVEGIVN